MITKEVIKMYQIKDKASLFPLLEALYHPKMVEVVDWYLKKFRGVQFVITSTFRRGDPGVHGTIPCRGLDLRCRHLPLSVQWQIETELNKNWSYDPERPAKRICKRHDSGRGIHFHLKVHDNTRRKEGI